MKRSAGTHGMAAAHSPERKSETRRRPGSYGAWGRTLRLGWVALVCVSGLARAETSVVEWNPNADREKVAGYIVSYGSVSRAEPGFQGYEANVDVGSVTRYAIETPRQGSLYIAIRAYSGLGVVSDFSEEIVLEGPGLPATGGASPGRGGMGSSATRSGTPGVKGAGGQPGRADESSSTNPSAREKAEQIAELEKKRDALLRTLTAKHPDVRALQRQLDQLRGERGISP